MVTDSRSFMSYPRHEYFRRVLCHLIGRDVENGELPDDDALIGPIIRNICHDNAQQYFRFNAYLKTHHRDCQRGNSTNPRYDVTMCFGRGTQEVAEPGALYSTRFAGMYGLRR